MPELPEVETIRRQLEEAVVGAVVDGVTVRRVSCYQGPPLSAEEVIEKVTRVGKYLYIYFVSGRGWVVHLKMTGRLVVDVGAYESLPHTRVVITLRDGRRIYYWDSRTFGYIKYVEEVAAAQQRQKQKLGPEPWAMTDKEFYQRCQRYQRPIKSLILDQAILSGVGNIYANDALWEAGIKPTRRANSLSLKEAKLLRASMCKVLERGLATGGASDNSYVNARGEKGSYQEEFRVYKRTGQPCHRCGTKLDRVVVGGRGSWVCVKCQK